ncbi:MAG TPA: EAL domain-containing protein [Acidimicrobiales bacterium]|nr:EAL domain-containing protein [Acidimicrobiales bacterium]
MRLLTFVEFLELLVFATLAAVSYAAWRRRGGRGGAWLAVTFGILAAVVLVSWFASPTATGAAIELLRRSIVLLLALFPYCLYRFTWTFAPGSRRVEPLARAATALVAAATLVVPSVVSPVGAWPWWYVAYGIAFSLDWTLLSLLSVARLWRAGRGQPTVARRRMRTLGVAAIVLNIALFTVVGSGGRGSAPVTLAAQCAGLLSAVLFLLGFVPPRALRTLWRRREIRAFRKAEAALMGADTADRVATLLLPHAAELVGAQAAMLVTEDGEVRARHGIGADDAGAAAARLPLPADPAGDPLFLEGVVAVPVRQGWLAVTTNPVAPFFGPEELSLLLTLAHLAGLALDRAELFDRERLGRRVLAEREFQLAEAQRTAQVGSYTWDLSTDVVTWSDEMMRLLGFSDEVSDKGAAFASRVHPDDRPRVIDAWRTAPQTSVPTSIEYRIVLPPGETRWIQGRVRPVVDDTGVVVRLIGTIQDITERKRAEEEIAFQATHDALTRLPNRVMFMERLSHALARRRRNPSGLAVLFLDLDRFKWLNDSLGHAAGDEVLVTVATRLRQALRPEDTLARFGGDEFVVLCEGVSSQAAALTLAERLRTALEAPIEVGGEETTLTLSVGVAYASPDGGEETAEALVRDADAAMYRAKERGRDRHELFDVTTRVVALARHETVNALRRGTERGEMVVHYQPQVDLGGERVVGVEALVRWNHPQRGLLTPGEFISLAEETGIIVPLGARVLSAACHQAVVWEQREDLPEKLCLSVNLAARQLLANDLCGLIDDVLRTSGLDASQLCLEITESVLLDDTEASARALGDLKALGVRVAVDDFGTGFSALSYLKRFPVDVLKIDRSFVVGLGRSREDRAIVASVVDLAHAFGLTTVAEGVETPEQLAELRALGCELAQGYLWSRPMPADAAAEWMATRTGAASSSPAAAPAMATAARPDPFDERRRRARVLLVDDDAALRRVVRMLLEDEEHFEVVGEAEDGREAVAVARHVRPDVVVLDLAMPGIGGLEALPLIQAVAPQAKVVVLSGLEPTIYGPTALRQGAAAYFAKRGDLSELVSGLDVLLASPT